MAAQLTSSTSRQAPAATCDKAARITKSLLGYGVLAGAVYIVAAGGQELTRSGFDPARHDVSLLANGSSGWIQIVNFVLTGLMTIAAAAGMRRAMDGQRAGTWGPRLIAGYGLGLVLAGVFRADPAYGFPPGTPPGPAPISWHGLGHLVAGGLGFLALIAACFVFARRFAALGRRGWAAYSAATGVLFLAGFFGVATGSGQVATTVAFTVAVVLAWTWLAAVSVHLYRTIEVDR